MIKEAIFHKADKEYCYAVADKKFMIKIKTKKGDMRRVNVNYVDKYLFQYNMVSISTVPMKVVASDALFDYYEAIITVDTICTRYHFELEDFDGNTVYYGAYNFYDNPIGSNDYMFDMVQNVREEEKFEVPEWTKGAVVYQIFPERFSRGSKRTEKGYADWNAPIERENYNIRLGGCLQGITESLDYIQELGVDAIYMTPVFRSPSNHKYNTEDYMEIDPEFGTKEDFVTMVQEAHARGIKVILDGVFNHSGDTFLPFKDIIEKGKESKYWDWYYIEDYPLIRKWGEKPNYQTFGYAPPMPKLNTRNAEVREYIFSVVDYWMQECDVDGWRLDVADEVAHDFWREFRKCVKKNNKDAVIIGEVWYEATPWLLGEEWDTVMNYVFRTNIRDWLAEGKIKPSEFADGMGFVRGRYHLSAYQTLWNLIGSHDAARFLTLCNEDKKKLKLAALIQMTMPGTPMVYYGDEVAMTGKEDPDCRRGMVWEEKRQDLDMLDFYKKIIAIRKSNEELRKGDFTNVAVDDEVGAYIFKRSYEGKECIVIINAGTVAYEYPQISGKKDLITNAMFQGIVPAKSGVIIKMS